MQLDHLTIAAPSLTEGVRVVEAALGVTIPFGTSHIEMGTHNHRLRIGPDVYLEVIAADPAGQPQHRRWFDLDEAEALQDRWHQGIRLRHWAVAPDPGGTPSGDPTSRFGPTIQVGAARFSLQPDEDSTTRSAWPCLIDRRGIPSPVERMPDLGVALLEFALEHPHPNEIARLYESLAIRGAPVVRKGNTPRYVATLRTPIGLRILR